MRLSQDESVKKRAGSGGLVSPACLSQVEKSRKQMVAQPFVAPTYSDIATHVAMDIECRLHNYG